MNEIRKFVIPYLKEEHGIEVEKSNNAEFNWFVPAPKDEISGDDDNQESGTHLASDEELLSFACELGYITDEDVFPSNI